MRQPRLSELRYTTKETAPFELVPVAPQDRVAEPRLPKEVRRLIVIDTVHDGTFIPEQLVSSPEVRPLEKSGELWRHYVVERDWGANMVAYHLARALGLEGHYRTNTARVMMDYNRFPGSSPPKADHFHRLAISKPLADVLTYDQKREILERYYDRISDGMEQAIEGKLIKIAVHTYDPYNLSLTERPEVSLITRSESYQINSHLPFGLFDPLFPDALVESTCEPVLRDRIALTLEKLGVRVEHNYPYCLPDGSLEVRCQPWMFFQHLRGLFNERYPDRVGRPSYERVWHMLLNTNHRRADSEVLFGYLHRFRRPSHGAGAEMAASRRAYEAIAEFLCERPDLVERFRRNPRRMSALGIEVRKDLLWHFDDEDPAMPLVDNARTIGEKIADAVVTYFEKDRQELVRQLVGGRDPD
jgi:hypothetical protein